MQSQAIKRVALAALAGLFVGCVTPGGQKAESKRATHSRPNVLIILADDLGWGDVGYHGSQASTPNLDRLASQGVELDQHYVTPQCTPTRASLMTGRYASRFDTLAATDEPAFPAETTTLPKLLKAQGYETATIGKWHMGVAPGHRPWEQGFDHSYGALTGAVHPWQHTGRELGSGPWDETWHRNGQRVDEKGENATELVTREAERWLGERNEDKPWFLYLAHFAVHAPVDAPDRFKAAYRDLQVDDGLTDDHQRYLAFTSQLDESVGRVEAALKARGLLENTIIIFVSDNGAFGVGKAGAQYGAPIIESRWLGTNGSLRGFKASTHEGGIRTPAFVSWPGRLQPRRVTEPLHVVDWLPTIAALVGAKTSLPPALDGQSVLSVLSAPQPSEERVFYWKYAAGMGALRKGDWKLVLPGNAPFALRRMPGEDRSPQLYNLSNDPNERNNLATANPNMVGELRALMSTEAEKDNVGRLYAEDSDFQWRP